MSTTTPDIFSNLGAMARLAPRKAATTISRIGALVIAGLLGAATAVQAPLAYAAPGDGTGTGLNPPNWCPVPTYNTSASFVEGFNAATRDASGWGIVVAFAIVPLLGVAIIFFARDSKWGQKIMTKMKDIGIGVGVIVLGTIVLTIILALIGVIVAAALSGVGIKC